VVGNYFLDFGQFLRAMLNFQGVHENLLCASLTINSRILSMNHTVQEEEIMFLGTIQFQPPSGKKLMRKHVF